MSESLDPDPNPYAAPQVASSVPNDLPHFGLTEPICLEGVKTIDDMLLAQAAVYGKRRWWQHIATVGWLVVLALVPLYYFTNTIPAGYLINLFLAIAAPSVYLLCMFVVIPHFKRRKLEHMHGKEGKAERYYLAEESLTRITASSTGEFRWERFACFRDAGPLLVLRLPEHQEDYVIPRSYCPSDSQWEVVQDLIACKLPQWEQGKPEPGPRQIETLVTPATVLEETPADSAEVEAVGQCTPRQWRQAQRLVRPYWYLQPLYATLLIIAVGIWSMAKWNENPSWESFIALCLVLTVFSAKFAAAQRSIHNAWLEKRGPFEVQNWSISAEQLKLTTATTNQTLRWDTFEKAIIRRHMVLLVSPNRTFCLLPRSFFASEEAWQQFLQIVGQKSAS